jgi:hypothetical protein
MHGTLDPNLMLDETRRINAVLQPLRELMSRCGTQCEESATVEPTVRAIPTVREEWHEGTENA